MENQRARQETRGLQPEGGGRTLQRPQHYYGPAGQSASQTVIFGDGDYPELCAGCHSELKIVETFMGCSTPVSGRLGASSSANAHSERDKNVRRDWHTLLDGLQKALKQMLWVCRAESETFWLWFWPAVGIMCLLYGNNTLRNLLVLFFSPWVPKLYCTIAVGDIFYL